MAKVGGLVLPSTTCQMKSQQGGNKGFVSARQSYTSTSLLALEGLLYYNRQRVVVKGRHFKGGRFTPIIRSISRSVLPSLQ